MNAVTLRKALEVAGITPEKYYEEDFASDLFKKHFGEHKLMKSPRSSAGLLVVHFVDHNIFLKAQGSYTSYSGVEFDEDEWTICEEKEEKIMAYPKAQMHINASHPENIVDESTLASVEEAYGNQSDDDSYESSYD